jgi:predicted phage tail protein
VAFQFLVALAVALITSAISYALTPKPKQPKPEAAKDLENPVAEAGKPIPVVFGTMTIKGVNVLWFGEKSISTYKVKV